MKVSRREIALKTSWKPYPAAEAGWIDVRDYLGSATKHTALGQFVCGRLSLRGPMARIESGGRGITFEFDPTDHEFEPALLIDGDIIAIQLAPKEASLTGCKTRLLTPNLSGRDIPLEIFSRERAEQWSHFLELIRTFFKSRDFVEAQTPTLVPSPGTEPFLDPFLTEAQVGSRKRTLYLPTSPEFHLKQLLVRGWSRIFELKPCFRNGESGSHHQLEFLMLEWYRAYSTLEPMARDVNDLLQFLDEKFLNQQTSEPANRTKIPQLTHVTISELFAQAFDGFQLKPTTTRDDLADLARHSGIPVSDDDSFDDIFFRLFLERIERGLGGDGPQLVSQYPPSQAALSRIGAHGFAERFEIYWRGLELANAFHELNDPIENETRFSIDALQKGKLGKAPVPRDENLVSALKLGLPPSGGIALGVDRLFMALMDFNSISETRAFPILMSRD